MIKISEISNVAPKDERGELETKVYQVLDKLEIAFERVDNDPVETMEECCIINDKLGAEIRKSIFVCDRKKTNFYLVIMPANKSFDTKKFSEKVGCSRVSFASAEYMEKYLGVLPGTATVMSILNDTDMNVQVVIDKEVAENQWFACNTGSNSTHIKISTKQLIDSFLPYSGHKVTIADL